jgi:hypothetical protein
MTTKPRKTELHDGSEWVDVTEHVHAEGVTVTSGRQEESAVTLLLDNSAGVPAVADRLIFLDGLSPQDAVSALARDAMDVNVGGKVLAYARGEVVTVAATPGRAQDQVVVGAHAYDGEWIDGAWRFSPRALQMACRVAGWRVTEVEPGRLVLS